MSVFPLPDLVTSTELVEQIPNPVLSGRGKCEKLTKINILHVTINYIRAMENLLTTGDSGVHSYSEMVRNPIRPDENAKHRKFEACDAAAGEISPSSSAATALPIVAQQKKSKNEIRDQMQNISIFLQGDTSGLL